MLSGCAPSAAHFDFFNSLRLLWAECLLLCHSGGYYTINDFEIKGMFGNYQTFLRTGGAAVVERMKGKSEEGKVKRGIVEEVGLVLGFG